MTDHPIVHALLVHAGVVLGVLLGVVLVLQLLRQRGPTGSTLAWLLAVVLVPYVGIPLNLAFGGRKRVKKALPSVPAGPTDGLEPAAVPVARVLASYGHPAPAAGHRLQLLPTGPDRFAALVRLIDSAEQTLDCTLFILHPDDVGAAVVERLAARARAGVRVRLLLDGVGSLTTHQRFLRPLTEAGGRVAFFEPLLHRPGRGRANLRNHRKIVVADGRQAYAGGANVAAEYLAPEPRDGAWQDLAFLVNGPAVADYAALVAADWLWATGETLPAVAPPPAAGSATLQMVASGPDVAADALYEALVSATYAATERVWIVTPYFVPDEGLEEALELAARRGVDVRVLVPDRSNHRLADLARGPYLRDLQTAGGTPLRYPAGMVHAKAVLVDHALAIIGSANVDLRSLRLNYEVALLAYSRPEVDAVAAWIETLAAPSLEGVTEPGAGRALVEDVARLVGPLL